MDALSRINPDLAVVLEEAEPATAEPESESELEAEAALEQPAVSDASDQEEPPQREPVAAVMSSNSSSQTILVELSYPEVEAVPAAAATKKVKAGRGKAKKKAVPDADKFRVPRVELGKIWGIDTSLPDWNDLLATDEEITAIWAIRKGTSIQSLEISPKARKNIAGYLGRDKRCGNFKEGGDGRLYHVGKGANGKELLQLVAPVEMRARLVIAKHEGCNGHRGDTLDRLKRKYFCPSMASDVEAWIDACPCQWKKQERPHQRVGDI